jgi:hypothetical protein
MIDFLVEKNQGIQENQIQFFNHLRPMTIVEPITKNKLRTKVMNQTFKMLKEVNQLVDTFKLGSNTFSRNFPAPPSSKSKDDLSRLDQIWKYQFLVMPDKKVTNGFYKETLQKVNKSGKIKDRVFVLDTSHNSNTLLYYKFFIKNSQKGRNKNSQNKMSI